jgi:hypothetical protein
MTEPRESERAEKICFRLCKAAVVKATLKAIIRFLIVCAF